jgi:thiopeptide-type bacteriocin biosynthesis protein
MLFEWCKMTGNAPSTSWLYYRIYVGNVAGGLEYLITDALPLIVSHPDIESWFFLRYTDEGGPHLRLRLKPYGAGAALERVVAETIAPALRRLPGIPPPTYTPAIARSYKRTPVRQVGVIRILRSEYQPEVEKFGSQGITIAETLFRISSDVAMIVLTGERRSECSRKTLAPILMQAVCDAFAPNVPSFWIDYTKYWLAVSSEPASVWQQRFSAKVGELKRLRVAICAPEGEFPVGVRSLLQRWRCGLAHAAYQFRELGTPIPGGSAALAFHFMHLMNNRLGFQPIEEAYWAALLADGIRQ